MSTHRRHLSIVIDPNTNLDAQMREVIRLRDQVRKAELSAPKTAAESPQMTGLKGEGK